MKIQFVGTGSAFTLKNFQTNTIIERNGKRFLIDAGGDIRRALSNIGLSYKDIDVCYITHAHADHIGGIEYLAFCSYFDPSMKDRKIKLIANNELMRELWNSSLRGGLKCIQGKQTHLIDFFDIETVSKNDTFEWEGITFHIVQSVHVMDGYAIVNSYGLIFEDPDTNFKVFYTGDTQFNPNQIKDFYEQSDLIIQDCETSPYKSGVHANYDELKTLHEKVKSKMILTHYQDNVLDENGKITSKWSSSALNDGFKGFAICGDIYEVSKVR